MSEQNRVKARGLKRSRLLSLNWPLTKRTLIFLVNTTGGLLFIVRWNSALKFTNQFQVAWGRLKSSCVLREDKKRVLCINQLCKGCNWKIMAERVSSEQLMFNQPHNFYACCMWWHCTVWEWGERGLKTGVLKHMVIILITFARALLTYWLLGYWYMIFLHPSLYCTIRS